MDMEVTGKLTINSGVGFPTQGSLEQTAEIVANALGVKFEKGETDEFWPFDAYYTRVLGLTIVILDPSESELKEYYELQVYGGSKDDDTTWIDISDYLINIFEKKLNITCRKL